MRDVENGKNFKPLPKPGQHDWGKCIRELRLQRGMSQGDIFRKTGIERHYVSRIESGMVKDPTIRTIVRIADALEISADDLVKYCLKKF